MTTILPCDAAGIIENSDFKTGDWPPVHPLAELLPPMTDAEFQALVDDIARRGQIEPAWLKDGMLLDGRSRMRALQSLDVPLRYREYRGDDPLGFVIATNVRRRHLSESQRAMLAAKLANMRVGDNQYTGGSANLPTLLQPVSQAHAAQLLNVSTRSVTEAVGIHADAVPEVIRACEAGQVSLRAAARISKLSDRDRRKQLVTGDPASVARRVRRVGNLLALERLDAQRAATCAAAPRIVVGDGIAWLSTLPRCDLLLTDPPYSTDVADVGAFARRWLPAALARLKPTGRAYVFVGAYPHELSAYLAVAMPAQVLVRSYSNEIGPAPSLDYRLNWQAVLYYRGVEAPALDCPLLIEQFAVQLINAPDGRLGQRYHTWQKPDALAERLIRHGSRAGDLVVDPFAGTGTFVLAASRLGRTGRGCEIDPDCAGIARQRGCEIEP